MTARGGIAHLVERLHGMQEVWGSNPHVSTRNLIIKKSAGYRDGNGVSSWAIAKMTNWTRILLFRDSW